MIALYGSEKYKLLFLDKKTTKKKVWDALGQEIVAKGNNFGERNPGVVCAQKSRNMESGTLKLIANGGPKNSGGAAVKKPPYFEDVHDVVKDKAKAIPKNIVDTLEEPDIIAVNKPEEQEDDPAKMLDKDGAPGAKGTSRNSPFLKVKGSSQPKKKAVKTNDIMEFLIKDSEKRDKQNEEMLCFLRKKAKKDAKRKKIIPRSSLRLIVATVPVLPIIFVFSLRYLVSLKVKISTSYFCQRFFFSGNMSLLLFR